MSTCWPALCPSHPGTSSTRLLVLGVSGTTSTTSARRQSVLDSCTVTSLVSPVALLAPGVSVVVVAQRLPETGDVVGREPETPDPLGALPEVQVWHQQAGRTAVYRLQGLPLVGVCHPRLASRHVLERQVRRVVAVAEGCDVLGRRLHPLQQRIHRDALPPGAQLRPLGDAVDVPGDLLRGQPLELLPRPPLGLVNLPDDGEVPRLQGRAWRGAGREDREAVIQVLAGRQLRILPPAAAPEAPRDKPFAHVPSLLARARAIGPLSKPVDRSALLPSYHPRRPPTSATNGLSSTRVEHPPVLLKSDPSSPVSCTCPRWMSNTASATSPCAKIGLCRRWVASVRPAPPWARHVWGSNASRDAIPTPGLSLGSVKPVLRRHSTSEGMRLAQ